MKTILAVLLLFSVALGGELPAKRQAGAPPAPLAVYRRGDPVPLGSVFAPIDGTPATLTSGPGSLFSFEGDVLFGPTDAAGTESAAFMVFPSFDGACGYISGNLTFAMSRPSDCASPGPFRLQGGIVQYGPSNAVRSFQLCGADQHIAWNRYGATDDCENVDLVFVNRPVD
ncbi:hypothetical protein PsYK624_105650 [Phanerochaete sordida]|uniref:Uncharacterized protein n=1 Tax=Phanerochaete sordida TaxID=48140 RepID=A0A9P3GGJ5_9APHY|nr:hypothetical protein PsYK624_105650 [Phanerochaete sordida]